MKFLLKVVIILLVGLLLIFIGGYIEDNNDTLGENIEGNDKNTSFSFHDDFSQGVKIGGSDWTLKQLQRGSIKEFEDPLDEMNSVLIMKAGEKQGSQVGKAGLIKAISHVGVGSGVVVEADFYFPEERSRNSLILLDLECKNCGIDTNPGIRLYLRDEYLRIDRSKIGINESFNQELDYRVLSGTWHNLRMEVIFGEETGSQKIFLDNNLVIDRRGTNVLTQSIVDEYNIILDNVGIDRVQIGMTANSNSSSQTLLLDNVSITKF